MFTKDVAGWEDFEVRLDDLRREHSAHRALAFRGLSDSTWPLTTTLERHGNLEMPFAEYFRVTKAAEPQVRTFTNDTWDAFESYPEIHAAASDYEALDRLLWGGKFRGYGYWAYLRHLGFPSPLLDWTRSPYVAAFFAFRSAVRPPADRVSIFVYCEKPTRIKQTSSGESQIFRLGPYVRAHRRHFLQQGEYTVCLRWDRHVPWRFVPHETVFSRELEHQDLLWKFTIPWSERTRVLKLLDDHNVNAFSLFESDEALLETIALRELTFRLCATG